jgi:hypothetical protein
MKTVAKNLILKACPGLEREVCAEFARASEYGYPAKIMLMGYIDRSEGAVALAVTERARMVARSLEDGFTAMMRREHPDLDVDTILITEEFAKRASKKAVAER